MSIERKLDDLLYRMEELKSIANNNYDEDGRDLIDRIEIDLEDIEYQVQRCKEALGEYEYALDNEESEEQEDE